MANEEEVVRSLVQSPEVTLEGDVPAENIAEYFGWELRNVQKRVPGAFEFDRGALVLRIPDLLLQSTYGMNIGLAVHSAFWPCQDLGEYQDTITYIGVDA